MLFILFSFSMKKSHLLSLGLAVTFGTGVAFAATSFRDVPSDHWAHEAITWNSEQGIMMGNHSMFEPNENLIRAEQAVVNKRMYDLLHSETEAKVAMLEARITALESNLADQELGLDPNGSQTESTPSIVDIAVNDEDFSTLVAALQAADLVETLSGDGPFTVFAPTNEAFAKLGEGVLEDLLKEENKDQLVSILTYHVVPGKVMSTDLSDGLSAATVQTSEVTFTVNDEGVKVNDAMVTMADIEGSNGVIHIIDTVILPPQQ